MTTLHVIRHGRASALEVDYDQLHAIGELQARALGAHLGRERQRFDAVYVGPLRRQLDTQRLMREAAGEVGAAWPSARVLDGLAEGPFELLFKKYAAVQLKSDAALQQLVEVYRATEEPVARDLALTALLAHMIGVWQRGEISADDLESAAAFEARVALALTEIAEREQPGREVAVVTSNGVIAALVARTRGFEARHDRYHLRVHNSSVSRFELCADGLELRTHDTTLHLSDPEHLTTL